MRHAAYCDCCTACFELNHKDTASSKHVNGMMLVDFDVNERYYTRKQLVLCPACMDKVYKTLGLN